MEVTPRSRVAKRAALLASTAIIALLSACQSMNTGASGSSTMRTIPSTAQPAPWGGYAW